MTDTALHLLRAITGHGLTDPDAIRAAWADDTPRLAYADLIEEEGDGARAEFIRCQVELAKRKITRRDKDRLENLWDRYRAGAPVRMKSKSTATLLLRERILLRSEAVGSTDDNCTQWSSKNRIVWFAQSFIEGVGGRFEYHRGFVSRLTCSWQSWRDHADEIREVQPVEEVVLTTLPDSFVGWVGHGERGYTCFDYPAVKFTLPSDASEDRAANDRLRQMAYRIGRAAADPGYRGVPSIRTV